MQLYGLFIPKHVIGNELVEKTWYEFENKMTQCDCMAKNIITLLHPN